MYIKTAAPKPRIVVAEMAAAVQLISDQMLEVHAMIGCL
jgi:hypothetical protein